MLKLSISKKLPMVIAGIAALAAIVTGLVAWIQADSQMQKAIRGQLTLAAEGKAEMLNDYLSSISGDLEIVRKHPSTLAALQDFGSGYAAMAQDGYSPKDRLQQLYISSNPHPAGEKEKFDSASDASAYSITHAARHPWFRTMLNQRGYYDIFLIDTEGNLVYSVYKEADFATNLKTGEWAQSDLGKVARAVLNNAAAQKPVFFDFAPYAPSNNAPAGFIGAPIENADGTVAGALVYQMPIDRLNKVMAPTTANGATGEMSIYGPDLLMRNDSRHSTASTILKRKVETGAADDALAGNIGAGRFENAQGAPAVVGYAYVDFLGVHWAILADIETGEAFAGLNHMKMLIIISTLLICAITIVAGIFFAATITKPVVALTTRMRSLAQGDSEADIPFIDRHDELGAMSQAVQVFRENAIKKIELEAEQGKRERRTTEEKRAMMHKLADDFDASVGGIVSNVSSAATELQATAQSMSGIAQNTSSLSTTVSAASEEASTNVQTVAAAAEEMSHSISEINTQVTQASTAVQRAVAEVAKTGSQMQSLATTADSIGEVVKMISDIAEQTNLLALNATIESARAGEAGRGFAVVASEVKELASQTGKATEGISTQIEEIQRATKEAVNAMGEIGQSIKEVDETTAAIATSMQEQGAATQEIARNVQEAASGSEEVSRNIVGVNQASEESGAAAGEVTSAAGELSQQSETLKSEVQKFIAQVRAA